MQGSSATNAPSTPPGAGPLRFDGYEIRSELEPGSGFDRYRAVEQHLGRKVLIQAKSPNTLPTSALARGLEREALALSRLRHPNVVAIYGINKSASDLWTATEWVDGWSLRELLDRSGALSPTLAAAIAKQLCDALEHVHQQGLVHRDVNPAQVLVGSDGRVRLTGFARARTTLQSSPPILQESGPDPILPSYLSPEQVLGETVDARSDLFSVGTLLYETLTQKRPFDGDDSATVPHRIRHDAPDRVALSRASVPPSLERILLTCLEKLASDRYRSAAELSQALSGFLNEPVNDDAEAITRRELQNLGLIPASDPLRDPSPRNALRSEARSDSVIRQSFRIFGAGLLAIVLGAALIEWLRPERQHPLLGPIETAAQSRTLGTELAQVRVVVDPWASVHIDGQPYDTTPFAEAIALTPGKHYFRFTHPSAPDELREVEIAAGESILLDVKMKLPIAEGGAGGGPPGPGPDEAGP